MEIKDYLQLIRRHWFLIVSASVIGLMLGGGGSLLQKPVYSSETQLFVAIQNTGSIAELQQGSNFSQSRVQSYADTVRTPAVLQPVIDELGLNMTPAQLANYVSSSANTKTVLLNISAENASPVMAASIARSVSENLIKLVDTLESTPGGGSSQVTLTVVTPATPATTPTSPNTLMLIVLGLFGGLSVGLGLAVLRSVVDTKIRGEADLQRVTEAPVLGGIAFDPTAVKTPLLTESSAQGPRAESYRQIRTNLQFANVYNKSNTILVTSSLPGEGKSTTATNMAIAMAQAGQRVVIVDADLRRPMVSTYLGLESNAGLTTALVGNADVEDLLQPWGENDLYVLTAGQIPPNPSEILGSEAMNNLILKLESIFDAVIIDAPPLIPVTDASVLAQKVGGVVLVVGSSKIKTQHLEKSLASLKLVDATLLGVVMNLLPTKGADAYSYSYYSSASSKIATDQPVKGVNGSHLRSRRSAARRRDRSNDFAR